MAMTINQIGPNNSYLALSTTSISLTLIDIYSLYSVDVFSSARMIKELLRNWIASHMESVEHRAAQVQMISDDIREGIAIK